MNKLRLLVTGDCNGACPECCDSGLDIASLPVFSKPEDFDPFYEVVVTGGDLMLYPMRVAQVISNLKKRNPYQHVILCTAKPRKPLDLLSMLHWVDGLILILRTSSDIIRFHYFNEWLLLLEPNNRVSASGYEFSFRLNVFKEAKMPYGSFDLSLWDVTKDIEWVENCPLPEGGALGRYLI